MSRKCDKVIDFIKLHSPTILTCMASVGVVMTTVSAVKAVPKANTLVINAQHDNEDELSDLQTFIVSIPAYIPSILIGTTTIACICCANILNKKQQATIFSACAMANTTFKEYRNRIVELYGKDVDKEVMVDVVRSRCDQSYCDVNFPDSICTFYEPFSKQTLVCYERRVMDAEYHFNRNYTLRGSATINEFLQFLGLDEMEDGDLYGWSVSSGIYWIDFEHRKEISDDGSVTYIIDTIFPPDSEYMEDWS